MTLLVKQIEKLASSLALKQSGRKIPVDIYSIANYLSIDIHKDDLGSDVSGVLVIKNGKGVIGVNVNESNNILRTRFTIAHEIGHYMLHRFEQNLFVDQKNFRVVFHRDSESTSGKIKMERQANAFAAALLMPKDLILQELNKKSFNMYDNDDNDIIQKLADKFEVSKQAMTFRLANLQIL